MCVAREGAGEARGKGEVEVEGVEVEVEASLAASNPRSLAELTSVMERTCCSSLCMLCTSADSPPTGSDVFVLVVVVVLGSIVLSA